MTDELSRWGVPAVNYDEEPSLFDRVKRFQRRIASVQRRSRPIAARCRRLSRAIAVELARLPAPPEVKNEEQGR